MRFDIETQVEQHFLTVKERFDKSLFESLNPPFPPVKIVRFDGSSKGDIVSLELDFFLFKQNWTSKILEDHTNSSEYFFIDQGVQLPFFLTFWKHKHRVIQKEKGSIIRDEIEYKAPFRFLTLLLYPVLYLQFWMRKPTYKKYFRKSVKPASLN